MADEAIGERRAIAAADAGQQGSGTQHDHARTKVRGFALEHLTAALHHDMVAAGAPVFETHEQWEEQTVPVDGMELFVEGRLTLTASGRPELAG